MHIVGRRQHERKVNESSQTKINSNTRKLSVLQSRAWMISINTNKIKAVIDNGLCDHFRKSHPFSNDHPQRIGTSLYILGTPTHGKEEFVASV